MTIDNQAGAAQQTMTRIDASGGAAPARKKSGCGCLGCGCGGLLILLLLLMGLLVFGVFKARSFAAGYLMDQPTEFASVAISEQRLDEIRHQYNDFLEVMHTGQGTAQTLALTADEANALLADLLHNQALAGQVHVEFQAGKIQAAISFQIKDLKLGALFDENQYLNAAGVFAVSLVDGRLVVMLDALEVGGQALPDLLIGELKAENLAKDLYNDPESVRLWNRVKQLEIKDGSLSITVAPDAAAGG